MALCSGQLYAVGKDETDEVGKSTRTFAVTKTGVPFQDGLPADVLRLVLSRASQSGADPRILERVCKNWHQSMHQKILLQLGVRYTTKKGDVFMEDCMRAYREGLVSRATLVYMRGVEGQEIEIPFSAFKDGAADLSNCGDEATKQVYVTDITRFLQVKGANENKLVTYIGPLHTVRDLLPPGANAISHIVFLWRLGDLDPTWFDYLTTSGRDELSLLNCFENWQKSESMEYGTWRMPVERGLRRGLKVFRFVCEPKLEL